MSLTPAEISAIAAGCVLLIQLYKFVSGFGTKRDVKESTERLEASLAEHKADTSSAFVDVEKAVKENAENSRKDRSDTRHEMRNHLQSVNLALDNVKLTIGQVLEQTTKTNGRVADLEKKSHTHRPTRSGSRSKKK